MVASKAVSRALIVLSLLGCGGPKTTASPAPPTSGPTAEIQPAMPVSTPTADAGSAPTAPSSDVASRPAKPAPVARTGRVWPFHSWDHAEAVTFNQFPMRENIQLAAYDDDGWSTHLVDRKAITGTQGKRAVELVTQTQGDVDVSKCPFPRHAVVLYDGEVPVASINICFTCGDILLWPHWGPRPDWDHMTDKQLKEHALRSAQQMKLHDRVFPTWKAFFRDDVGFPIDATYH